MTDKLKEKLIEEAKLRYPIGTKFYSAYCKEDEGRDIEETSEIEPYWYGSGIAVRGGEGVVYYNGTWAQLVNSNQLYSII